MPNAKIHSVTFCSLDRSFIFLSAFLSIIRGFVQAPAHTLNPDLRYTFPSPLTASPILINPSQTLHQTPTTHNPRPHKSLPTPPPNAVSIQYHRYHSRWPRCLQTPPPPSPVPTTSEVNTFPTVATSCCDPVRRASGPMRSESSATRRCASRSGGNPVGFCMACKKSRHGMSRL